MRAVSSLTSSTPALFADPQTFVMANVESSAEEVVEAATDDIVTKKELSDHVIRNVALLDS